MSEVTRFRKLRPAQKSERGEYHETRTVHQSSTPVLFLTLTSTVLASNTWYADGVNGNDADDCQTVLTACKTIGHAISLAS